MEYYSSFPPRIFGQKSLIRTTFVVVPQAGEVGDLPKSLSMRQMSPERNVLGPPQSNLMNFRAFSTIPRQGEGFASDAR